MNFLMVMVTMKITGRNKMRGLVAKRLRKLVSMHSSTEDPKTYYTDPLTGARILSSQQHVMYKSLKRLKKKGV